MKSQTILHHLTADDLASAVHENLYALFRSMQVIPGCEIVESDTFACHHASLTNPMFRGVWKTRLSPDEIEHGIDAAIAWFEERNAPSFFWWTDSFTQPPDLTERLMRRGFDGNVEGDPGMALDLHSLAEEMSLPKGFTITRAFDRKSLEDWRDVFAAAFDMPLSGGQAWIDATVQAGGSNAPWQLYVGYYEGKPVATSILFNGAGVAGIYGVGTLPEWRRKGFGAAITLKPLLDARRQGIRFAVLFATRLGYPMYQRLGFREVACKIGVYILEKV
jgi:ribosomal protein S18 acetylase RimI-like enzyme